MGACDRGFDEAHFAKGWAEVRKFFGRFGEAPSLRGKRVLDVGCGRGNLAIHAVREGAAAVMGVDPDAARIQFAAEMLGREAAPVQSLVAFQACGIEALPAVEAYDLMFSKDAFEHIMDVPAVLSEMRRRLVPGGRAFIGFGPLYRSPFGDHHWAEADVPWGHLFLPERMLLRRIERRTGHCYSSLAELELNRWRLGQFLDAFRGSMTIESLQLNRGEHPVYRASRVLGKLPLVGEYCTFNVYCILRKT
jgi:2-polyprenyl-3-methyl-5-hydroxy-6-metoxy-1,4-benzoquinol methylase